jgi:DNA primase
MQDRIAIPLHNSAGPLVGYAGRLVDDRNVSDERPKYLFPGPRERDGKRWEFHKGELLYNLYRIERPVHDLIIVEGFASVWWLHQHGRPNAVALMGHSIS